MNEIDPQNLPQLVVAWSAEIGRGRSLTGPEERLLSRAIYTLRQGRYTGIKRSRPAQIAVAKLVAEGMSYRQIAAALQITFDQAQSRVRRMGGREACIDLAEQHGARRKRPQAHCGLEPVGAE